MIEKRQRKRRDGSTYAVWRVRWYDTTGTERSRTFDRAADARAFEAKVRTLKRADDLDELDAGKETLADSPRSGGSSTRSATSPATR